MGKNLKGRECGKGIYQRKDGLYSARFVDRAGKRHEKYFQTVPEARNWIADAKYADAHAEVFVGTDITVDEWFDFWIENIVGDLAPNTLRNYRDRYKHNIQPVIGRIKLTDVKPMHCKKVFITRLFLWGWSCRTRSATILRKISRTTSDRSKAPSKRSRPITT